MDARWRSSPTRSRRSRPRGRRCCRDARAHRRGAIVSDSSGLIESVNKQVEAARLAALLNHHPEKIKAEGDTIQLLCPLHQEQAFRCLYLDPKTSAYRCMRKSCEGFAGGTFVDLWARR